MEFRSQHAAGRDGRLSVNDRCPGAHREPPARRALGKLRRPALGGGGGCAWRVVVRLGATEGGEQVFRVRRTRARPARWTREPWKPAPDSGARSDHAVASTAGKLRTLLHVLWTGTAWRNVCRAFRRLNQVNPRLRRRVFLLSDVQTEPGNRRYEKTPSQKISERVFS
jgi:hypothetical protein